MMVGGAIWTYEYVFDKYYIEYDSWKQKKEYSYLFELSAFIKVIPCNIKRLKGPATFYL